MLLDLGHAKLVTAQLARDLAVNAFLLHVMLHLGQIHLFAALGTGTHVKFALGIMRWNTIHQLAQRKRLFAVVVLAPHAQLAHQCIGNVGADELVARKLFAARGALLFGIHARRDARAAKDVFALGWHIDDVIGNGQANSTLQLARQVLVIGQDNGTYVICGERAGFLGLVCHRTLSTTRWINQKSHV